MKIFKKRIFVLCLVITLFALLNSPKLLAQNSSPYWSQAGNSDATSSSMLGTTNSVPFKFYTNNAQRMVIDSIGRVGINTSSPVNLLTVRLNGTAPAASWLGTSTPPVFMGFAEEKATNFNLVTAADASGFRPVLNSRRSRGTLATPTAVHLNDFLSSFVVSGYDGTDFQNPATIDFYVDGIPLPGSVPGRISFVTGSNASNRLERLKVGSTGNFNFNNNQLTIAQATGNVGIGLLNPDYKVGIFSNTVEGNNNTNLLKLSGRNPLVGFYDESNKAYGYIKSWTNAPYAPFTNGMVIGSNPGYPIFLSTNYGATMTIADNNKVGIGATTPEFKLDIKSSDVESNNNTNILKLSGRNPLVGFYDESNKAYGYIKSWTNAPYAPFSNGMVIGSNPGNPIFLSTNFGATMTIANNNKVGIGTTTPQFKLEIKSSDIESSNNTHMLKLSGRNPLVGFYDENDNAYGYIKSWTNGPYAPFSNGMLIGSNPGYPIFLSTNYGMTMIIANNNNVGIGTVNPAYKLSVNGTIQAKELRVETGWADYVFEKAYKLRSLNEVENFINTNKHLPDVTPGFEIENGGLEVGKVSSQMVRKIEELTLYIIDLQKQINELKPATGTGNTKKLKK